MKTIASTRRENGGTTTTYTHPDGSVTRVWVKDKEVRHG